MKRIIIFLLLVFIIIAGILLFVQNRKSEPIKLPVTQTVKPTITQIPFVTPSGEKMEINGVLVNNFYQKPLEENRQSDVLIVNNNDYQIVYLQKFSKFIITILNTQFEKTREIAEKEILIKLGIDQNEACKLSVEINTLESVNIDLSGKIFPLSFCSKP